MTLTPQTLSLLAAGARHVYVPVEPQPPREWGMPPARLHDGYLNRWGCYHDETSIICPFRVGDVLEVDVPVSFHATSRLRKRIAAVGCAQNEGVWAWDLTMEDTK